MEEVNGPHETENLGMAYAADTSSVASDRGIVVLGAVKDFDLGRGKRLRAVDGVSFEISEGEFVAVIGPSGCGKSTILRMIASLEQPTEGEVRINDTEPSMLAQGHRLGVAFQDHALLPWLNVWENVALPFRAAGMRPRSPLPPSPSRRRDRRLARAMRPKRPNPLGAAGGGARTPASLPR